MENWFWLSLLSAAFYAASTIVDKINFKHHFKDSMNIFILRGFVGIIFLLVVLPVFKINLSITTEVLYLSVLAGFCYFLAELFYCRALFIEDSSTIAGMIQLTPVFVAIISFFILNERFEAYQYIGVILLTLGSTGISLRGNFDSLKISSVLKLIIPAAVLYAIFMILLEYLVRLENYITVFFFSMFFFCLFSLTLCFVRFYRQHTFDLLKQNPAKPLALFALVNLLIFGGGIFSTQALSTGDVTLVSALSSTFPLFVLLFSILFSVFLPIVLIEDITKSTIAKKLSFISMIILGAYLIS